MKLKLPFSRGTFLAIAVFGALFVNQSEIHAACNAVTGLNNTNITNVSARFNWSTVSCDSFLIRYWDNAAPGTVYFKTVSSGSATNVTIYGLYPNVSYRWLIRTYCNGGQSGPYQTVPASFTTTNSPAYCVKVNQTSTSAVTSSSATVSWNTLISADTFMVRYHVYGTTSYTWIKVPGSSHALTLTGLSSNISYSWIVRCICTGGGGGNTYSNPVVFTTLSSSCTVPDVAYFSNNNVTANSATMGWASVSGAQSYNVRYAIRYSGNWTTVSSTTTSKSVTGLQASTWYEFQVQTVCASGTSAWSSSGIFQTLSSSLALSRGPYIQLATTNSIYVRWRTSVSSDTKVRYGTSMTNYAYTASSTVSTTEHIIQLTGLSANTKYYYTIGSTSTQIQGDSSNYFYTHPTVGSTGTVRMWVIGDFGVGSSQQISVRDAYKNYRGSTHTNVWLSVGDNAYSDGTDAQYTSNVFNYYTEAFKKWVFWPSTGNHDLASASASSQTGPYFDIFSLPTNAQAGGVASGTEAYYSFNYANVHFVCLESNDASFRSTSGAQATWLNNDLNANTQRWTIVYFHHPPYSKGSHDSDASTALVEMRTNFGPIFENHKVDLVLAGHSHSYERTWLIKGHFGAESTFSSSMKINSGSGVYPNSYVKSSPNFDGTVYAVCGVAAQVGSTSSGWPHNAMYKYSNTKYGSLAIDVTGDRLDAKFVLNDGSIWDEFTIQKSGAREAGFSLENVPVGDLSVFPNPATNQFTLLFRSPKSDTRVTVLDINGRQVYYTEVVNNNQEVVELKINRSEMFARPGIYFVRLVNEENVITKKLLIED